jgi:S1-C subfamily serine protease
MNAVDLLLVLFLVFSFARGYRIGLARQAGSTIGFVLGLLAGSVLASALVEHIDGALNKSLTSLFVVLGVSLLCMTIGEVLGLMLKRKLADRSVDKLDGGLGSVMAVATTLFAVWLFAAIIALGPTSQFQTTLKRSYIISSLEHSLPPASQLLSSLNKLIDPNGFPRVFSGREPSPDTQTPLPSLGSFDAVVAAARPSVVRVEGLGCGGIVEGTGFVYSDDEVVTNAHVVAGVRSPKVIDANGTHNTRVVWFDPDLDLAVLRVNGLAGEPLTINTADQRPGTPGVVLGYPGGGAFSAQTASVIDLFNARGRNIYGQGPIVREVYSIQAEVVPGNSGGPVLGQDGSVYGVVFATSTTYNTIGYALTGQQVAGDLAEATRSNTIQNTQSCSE